MWLQHLSVLSDIFHLDIDAVMRFLETENERDGPHEDVLYVQKYAD